MSDVNSEIIKKFGILNTTIDSSSKNYGIPNPGLYFIDNNLIVKSKQFEKSFAERPSAESVLAVHFNKEIDTYKQTFKSSYLTGSIAISDTLIYPSQIFTLVVKFFLQNKFHLYVEPVPEGFTALTIDLDSNPNFTMDPFQVPDSKQIVLKSAGEVFHAVSNEITLKSFIRVNRRPQLGSDTLTFTIKFQACDDKICMPPENLSFQFPVTITGTIN